MKNYNTIFRHVIFSAAVLFVFLLSGCPDFMQQIDDLIAGNTGVQGHGKLTVHFEGPGGVPVPELPNQSSGAARTILPGTPDFSGGFIITFKDTATEGTKPDVVVTNAVSPVEVELPAGNWIVQVHGYVSGASEPVLVASGESDPITVDNGTNTNVPLITLRPLAFGVNAPAGTFAWNIANTTTGVDTAEITLTQISDNSVITIDLNTIGYSGSRNIPAGYYTVDIVLTKNGTAAGVNPVAHIYPNLVTTANYSFSDSNFVSAVMLAGTVTITKPDALILSGVKVAAWSDVERTNLIVDPVVVNDGKWSMKVPFADLPANGPVYFTVLAWDDAENEYISGGDTQGPVPGNGMPGINLSLTILSSTKAITAFSITSPEAAGIITGTNIAVTVPYGTDVTSLPTFIAHNGASINPASGVARDFTSPVTYTVTAENGLTETYTVTVIEEDAPPDSFVPVARITGVPDEATVGTSLTLTGTVEPETATNNDIIWSITNAGNTGAALASDGRTLDATEPGTVTVLATIVNGMMPQDYTQSFSITVTDGGGSSSGGSQPVEYTFIGPADETITLGTIPALSWAADTPLTLTVTGSYTSYQWYLGETLLTGETNATLTRTARQFETITQRLTVRVTKDDVPYTKEIEFTVTE
jgi:hypothetical protein